MKGKYLLVIVLLLVSLNTMAQRRKRSSPPPEEKTEAPVPVTNNLPAPDTTRHIIEDVIPEPPDYTCTALMQLVKEASNDFEKTKGKVIESIATGTRWTSTAGFPGAITTSLMHTATKWQYEGVVYQGNSKDDMKEAVEKYKNTLSGCLSPQGFVMSSGKSATSKGDNNPEYKYTRAVDKSSADGPRDSKHNPRATLNIEYTAGADIYVVTVNIWTN